MWVLIFSLLMQAVYLIISKWNYTVLLGNLLGDAAAVLNFFLLGVTVQKAAGQEEKKAKTMMQFSRIYRLIGMSAVIIIGIFVPVFGRAFRKDRDTHQAFVQQKDEHSKRR